ncbi:MAG: manganese efflux pump [Desulfobacteraceae bacterium]|nr:manganese efflux pump [Desulfobacteraceae bacterium]
MHLLNLYAIAVALAMDAFAVAIATGVTLKSVSMRQTFRLAWHFGLFQALMPVIGWSAGLSIRDAIAQFDHWIAFVLLAYVGGGMIRSAFKMEKDENEQKDPTKGMTMVMLSIATSIDALAVGFSLSIIHVSIWTPAVIIGVVAGVFTTAGIHLGKAISTTPRFSKYAEGFGGVVLLLIGLKILVEHGVFNSWGIF